MDSFPHLQITVDVFERGCAVPTELARLGVDVEVTALVSGDYRIGRDVLIERKTVSDLHGSLASGRLFAQIGRVRDEASCPYLLVEGGDLDAGPRHPNAVRGALLAIAELGVSTIRSVDSIDSARWLHRLVVRQARRRAAASPPARRAAVPGVAVLAGVPGISTAIASSLVERFGSVEGVLAAGPDAWAAVEGIGRVRAQALAAALLRPGAV